MWEKFEKWFELNLGWFFVNGRKQAARFKYLKKKYGEEKPKISWWKKIVYRWTKKL